MKDFYIGNIPIGENHQPFVIAASQYHGANRVRGQLWQLDVDKIVAEGAEAGEPVLTFLGYALDNTDMLHIDAVADSRVECWRRASWLGKLEGIYRIA